MNRFRHARLRTIVVLIALTLAMGLVPQFAQSNPVSAQTSTGALTSAGGSGGSSIMFDLQATATGTASPVATGTATPTTVPATVAPTPAGTVTPGTLAFTTTSLVTVCGTVTAYTAVAGSAAGSITIAGFTITIAPGASIVGVTITSGGFYCVQATFNSAGQITSATVAAVSVATPSVNVCGTVTAYTAATATTAGTITIGGGTLPISAGVTFTGKTITTGSAFCLAGFFNTTGQLSAATISTPLSAAPVKDFESSGGYRTGRAYND